MPVFTVTACFQNPPAHLLAQAWRILLEVCRGKELLPEHARAYARRAVVRAGQRIPDDLLLALQQGADAGEGPGSASPGGALASSSGSPPPRGPDVPARSAGQALPALRHGPSSFQQPQGRLPPRTSSPGQSRRLWLRVRSFRRQCRRPLRRRRPQILLRCSRRFRCLPLRRQLRRSRRRRPFRRWPPQARPRCLRRRPVCRRGQALHPLRPRQMQRGSPQRARKREWQWARRAAWRARSRCQRSTRQRRLSQTGVLRAGRTWGPSWPAS